jgi:hypothetical protein
MPCLPGNNGGTHNNVKELRRWFVQINSFPERELLDRGKFMQSAVRIFGAA